ncbi:MOSC domain-containing protein [Sneathiella aquimaris]
MGGEQIHEASVSEKGIDQDRVWAIRDEKTKTIRGAKHFGDLMHFSARCLERRFSDQVAHVEITLPSGKKVCSDDDSVHQFISEALGRAVTLWPIMPENNDNHYRLQDLPKASSLKEFRRSFGLEDGEPLPDMSGFPKELLREFVRFSTPRGTYFDAYPINILTTASLFKLASFCPDSSLDRRRFRPNILVSDNKALCDFVEDGWLNNSLIIGSSKFEIETRTVRCVMVTRSQPEIPKDTVIMRRLVEHASQKLSVYATVSTPGNICTGNVVTLPNLGVSNAS